jgi:hypothetical protein
MYTKFRWSELCGLFVLLEPPIMENPHAWMVDEGGRALLF